VLPDMAKKKEENGAEIRNFLDSDLSDKLQEISKTTGLSDQELFRKWIIQEESNLHALRHYVEGIRLRPVADEIDEIPQRLQRPEEEPSQDSDEPEEFTESDEAQSYRRSLLQRIQDMRRQGMTYTKIASQLNKEGVATVSGTGKWYPSTISQMLMSLL
jgi:hypothetical protein